MRAFVRSLVGRVALASAAAAALGGTVAALSMGVTAKELVATHESKSLKAAARTLAKEVLEELDEEDEHPSGVPVDMHVGPSSEAQALARALADELDDVKIANARAVIRAGDRTLAGDASLPLIGRGACSLVTHAGTPVRACTVPLGPNLLTLVAPTDAERDRNVLISRALLVGLVCGALLGGLASFWMARWALAPLTSLRDRVRAVRADDPQVAPLGAPVAQAEVEELRSAIAQLLEQLAAALRQAQAFAAEAAHELRTPLTTIGGELELIAEGGVADAASLQRVRRQVASLTELVQRLLVLAHPSRIDAARAEVVDLSDALEAAIQALPAAARDRLDTQVADDAVVRGDAALLRALLVNGLDNALKFSRGRIHVAISVAGGCAQIDIVDDGPGIAAAERERVFTPFYRSPAVRAEGTSGHGIGLALIARVAWAHGGTAAFVDSARGAHLRVRIPIWQPSADASLATRT